MGILTGKKILVCSPANDHSMAWGIAKKAHEEGADIAMTYGMPGSEGKVKELADSIDAKFLGQYDVLPVQGRQAPIL